MRRAWEKLLLKCKVEGASVPPLSAGKGITALTDENRQAGDAAFDFGEFRNVDRPDVERAFAEHCRGSNVSVREADVIAHG